MVGDDCTLATSIRLIASLFTHLGPGANVFLYWERVRVSQNADVIRKVA